jgi:NADPH:quinone reductase-like Zn-dependent oxidoreductase
MMEMRSRGLLKPRVGLALPLEKAVEAQRRMQERRTVGKVVLTVG